MDDLWTTDHKVLAAIAEQTEGEGRDFADTPEIAERLGLDDEQLGRSLRRLHRADLFRGQPMLGGSWAISGMTERGLREVGAWPSADQLIDRVIAALADAADREPDPVKRSKLRGLLASVGEVGQKTLTEIVASYAAKMSGAA